MDKHNKRIQLINKVNNWLDVEYEENYDHRYIVQLIVDNILDFLDTNRLKLNCEIDEFYDYLVNFLYKYSIDKPYKNY